MARKNAPAEVKSITLEEAKAREDLVKKALQGDLVEKSKLDAMPEKSENTRNFNVFVDDECLEVAVDEVGGSPVLSFLQAGGHACGPAAVAPVPAAPRPFAPAAATPAPPAPAAATAPAAPKPAAAPAADGTPLSAPMPGMIVSYQKKWGIRSKRAKPWSSWKP